MENLINKDVKRIIDNYCAEKREDKPTKEEEYLDFLRWKGSEVYSEVVSEHRWYNVEEIVVKLGGEYIKYFNNVTLGDIDISDLDGEYDYTEIEVVEPYETVTIAYKPKNKDEQK